MFNSQKFIVKTVLCVIGFLLSVDICLSDITSSPLIERSIHFQTLTPKDGLGHFTVEQVHQDKHGFMWFCTNNGLDRYDGNHFKHYLHDPGDPQSISYNQTTSIFEDSDGNFWIGTNGGGLNLLNTFTQTFSCFLPEAEMAPGSRGNRIQCISPAYKNNNLLIGTLHGIKVFDMESKRFIPNHGLTNRLNSLLKTEVVAVHSIYQLKQFTIIGTGTGLAVISEQNSLFFKTGDVRDIEPGFNNKIWAASFSGVIELTFTTEPENPVKLSWIPELKEYHAEKLTFDQTGISWIGTVNGLIRYNENTSEVEIFRHRPDDSYSLPYDNINDVEVDSSGMVWVSTWGGGVCKTQSSTASLGRIAHNENRSGSLSNNEVMTLRQDSHKNIWVGTWKGGVNCFRPDSGSQGFINYRKGREKGSVSSDIITSLLEDSTGRIWIGSREGGVNLYHPESDSFEVISFDKDPLARINLIHSLQEDKNGKIWAGSSGGGIAVLNPDTRDYRIFRQDNSGLSDNDVWTLAQGPEKMIWAGTNAGLNLISTEDFSFTVFQYLSGTKNSLPHNRINCLKRDKTGNLWIGTGKGLAVIDADSVSPVFRTLTFEDPKNNIIASIEVDNTENLWISTDYNLIKLKKDFSEIRFFDYIDGAQTMGYMTNSSMKDTQGRIWMGGLNGITVINTEQIKPPLPSGTMVITNLFISNREIKVGEQSVLKKPIYLTDSIKLDYTDYPLAFEFALLQYNKTHMHRFAYKMEGMDEIWIDTGGSNRRASYSHLTPGSYVFKVKGKNSDGNWSEAAKLKIIVTPPWWNTIWAKSLFLTSLIFITLLIHFIRLRNIEKSKQLLETQVADRTSELKQANIKLDKASKTDPLTGLNNRRGFIDKAFDEIKSARKSDDDISIGIADIDNFKHINDTYGHDAGDAVLKTIAEILNTSLRKKDLTGRWGGEEFILLFSETDINGAQIISEKIRQIIETSGIDIRTHTITVTITIGLSSLSPGDSFEDCLKHADTALYQGKTQGRNRVISFKDNG